MQTTPEMSVPALVMNCLAPSITHSPSSKRARVFVDTREGALKEGGDIVQPLANGTIDEDDVIADLFELSRGQQTGRLPSDATSITLFKSVGAALEDLAAAELAVGSKLVVSTGVERGETTVTSAR